MSWQIRWIDEKIWVEKHSCVQKCIFPNSTAKTDMTHTYTDTHTHTHTHTHIHYEALDCCTSAVTGYTEQGLNQYRMRSLLHTYTH